MALVSLETDTEEEIGAAPLNRLEVLRGLRISVWEGSFASVWLAMTTGAFLTGYALWLGADSQTLGLISAIPTFAALAQIISSFYGERLRARKAFTAWFTLSGRALWLPILLLPLVLPHAQTLLWFLVLYTLSYVLLNIPLPAYFSWMSDLVPPDHRGRYFGRRNMIIGIVALVAGLPAAWFSRFRHAPPSLGIAWVRGIVWRRGCGGPCVRDAAAAAGRAAKNTVLTRRSGRRGGQASGTITAPRSPTEISCG